MKPQPDPQAHLQPQDATTRGHVPHAAWMVGGLFRFDEHLFTLVNFLATYYPARAVARVAGAPPCAWTLETQGALRPMLTPGRYLSVLKGFAELRTGVTLVFDNPLPTPDSLQDEYAHGLVKQLLAAEHNPTGRNAVCVASDELAELLRTSYPKLPIICHPNRLLMDTAKRTPEFYEALEKRYNLIILHPRDAVAPGLYTKLKHVGRYMAVVNDPAPRNCPTRRDMLRLLAEMHRRPWDGSLARSYEYMVRVSAPRENDCTCNLTRQEEAALYAAGIRQFIVQGAYFRNEITLMHDIFYHLLRTTPELSNKAALITNAAMAHIRPLEDSMPSGMAIFSTAEM